MEKNKSIKIFVFPLPLTAAVFILLSMLISCTTKLEKVSSTPRSDSLQIEGLLSKGDSIYAVRNGMADIGKSMVYFDSARRIAERLKDTALIAKTFYFIGNVYNAWNKEPATTVSYYIRSADLFAQLPAYVVREYYLRYLIAHAYDNEKGKDSLNSIRVLTTAIDSLLKKSQKVRASMDYLSDYAWVSTNCNNYDLAEYILQNLTTRAVIRNNPTSNNYLDHYYLTRARIDVFKYHKRNSLYIDSLTITLAASSNRFDSAYYCLNLSKLYSASGQYQNAYHFLALGEQTQTSIDNSSVLSDLQQKLLTQELQVEKEKEQLARQDIQNKNLYLFIAGLLLLIVVLSAFLDRLSKKRKEAKKEMVRQAQFTHQLLQKEEDERKRIATELHDGVNHDLLTIKNRLHLKETVNVADIEAITASIREVCRNLYPALFENVGLVTSIQALCDKMTSGGLFTTCDINYQHQLSKPDELQLYRIVQEAVTNTSKHAEAEAAKVTINLQKGEWLVEIKDNGKGFDDKEMLKNPASFGLQSMLQRAKVLGAHLSFERTSNETKIILTKKV